MEGKMADSKAVKDLYEEALKKQENAIKNAYLSGTDTAYQGLADEAGIEKAMQERDTARGDRAAGITSKAAPMTVSQRSESNLRNTLGKISRQHENFDKNVDLALSKLQTQTSAEEASYAVQNASDKASGQLSQSNFEKQYGLQKKQADFNEAYELFMSRKIGKGKFKEMTGIEVRALPKPQPLSIKLPPGYTGTESNRKGYRLVIGRDKNGVSTKYLVKNDIADAAQALGVSLFDNEGLINSNKKIFEDINTGIQRYKNEFKPGVGGGNSWNG